MSHILKIIGYLVGIFCIGVVIISIVTELSQVITTRQKQYNSCSLQSMEDKIEDESQEWFRMELYDWLGDKGYICLPFCEFSNKLKENEYSYHIFEIAQKEGFTTQWGIKTHNGFIREIFGEYEIIDTHYNRKVVATTYYLYELCCEMDLSMQDFAYNLLNSNYRRCIYNEIQSLGSWGTFEDFENDLCSKDETSYYAFISSIEYLEVDFQKALSLYLILSRDDDMPLNFNQFYYNLTKSYNAKEIYIRLLQELGNECKYIIGNTEEEFINYICNPAIL